MSGRCALPSSDSCGLATFFYDVGANIGVFAFIAAPLVGEHGHVYAFEPEQNNIVCFKRSAGKADLENIMLFECAVGSKDGAMTFDRRGGAFSGRTSRGNQCSGR